MAKYDIGDRVTVAAFDDLPNPTKGMARLCGKSGTVVDVLYSVTLGCDACSVQLDGAVRPSTILFTDEMLREDLPPLEYSVEVAIEENLVMLYLYKQGKLLRKTHAHIIHDDDAGIAQAISYAGKRLFYSFPENQKKEGGAQWQSAECLQRK